MPQFIFRFARASGLLNCIVLSPSVSSEAAGSSGNASGPATQILASGVAGPSQTPSPSVSGLAGSVSESSSLSKLPV